MTNSRRATLAVLSLTFSIIGMMFVPMSTPITREPTFAGLSLFLLAAVSVMAIVFAIGDEIKERRS